MNEDKSMVEYKEQKGLLNWLKTKFESFKEKFGFKKQVQQNNESKELTEEELDKVTAGYPSQDVEQNEKSWVLTEEQKREANEPTTKNDSTELSIEELDKITAGVPIVEEDDLSL